MKKHIICALAIALVAILFVPEYPLGQETPPKPIEWKILYAWPEGYIHRVEYGGLFVNRVNERAKGNLIIKTAGGPEAWPVFEQQIALSQNAVQLLCTTPPYAYAQLKESGVALMVSSSIPEMEKVGLLPYLTEIYEKKANVHWVGGIRPGNPPTSNFYSNNPIRKLEDFKGLKCRTIGSFQEIAFITALGMSPVNVATTELYTSMQKGLVNVIWFQPDIFYQLKLYEIAKYQINPGFMPGILALLANLDAWNSLPAHLKVLLSETALEVMKQQEPYFATKCEEAHEAILRMGVKKLSLSKEESAKFNNMFYEEGMKMFIKVCPDTGPRIKELTDKLRR